MKYNKSVFRSLAMVTQLGLCVLVPVGLGIAAGSCIDARFGTDTLLIFVILGVLGGAKGAYDMAQGMIQAEKREEEALRKKQREQMVQNPAPSAVRPKRPSRVRAERSDRKSDKEDSL